MKGTQKSMPGGFTLLGKVYLVGAGPGGADLLTVRAANLLRRAEVVLHDDLVSAEVLELIPANAFVQNVGKRCGTKTITQEEINRKLIAFARQGRMVVRLKIGDPLIFGRAQEEIDALRAAGIEFEIVPGVTAAFAAAAEARISLTNRKSAARLVLLSNHQSEEKAFASRVHSLAKESTLAVYMPGSDFEPLVTELAEVGVSLETPCLLVSNATRKGQKIHETTLKDLPVAPIMEPPSLLLVGELAKVCDAHDPMAFKMEETLDITESNSHSAQVFPVGDEGSSVVETLTEGKNAPLA